MSLEARIRAAPKAELHVHLEGSVRPATLRGLADRNGVELPFDPVEAFPADFRYRDFGHFLEIYRARSRCYRTADDFELVVVDLAAQLAAQNVRYAEVTTAPSPQARSGVADDAYLAGIGRGRERARAEHGVEINWIFAIGRSAPEVERWADHTTAMAIEGRDVGVVALGLGGHEQGHPPEPFAPYFERARAAGLRSAPHAGETDGPASIWGALRALGAERIAHGVRAVEDPALVEYLAEHGVALDVTPTSNVCLGVFPSLAAHPLRRLLDAGVPVTVSTDCPAMFGCSLSDELAALGRELGLGADALDAVLLNPVRHSFAPAAQRADLEAELGAALARH